MAKLKITGVGEASATPDIIKITMMLSVIKPTYGESCEYAERIISSVCNRIDEILSKPKQVKTTDYKISTAYKYVKKEESSEHVFIGYKCEHNIAVKIPLDFELFDKILCAVEKVEVTDEPDSFVFKINFMVENAESLKKAVLRNAVSNAEEKANIIAESTGKELLGIIEIDYSFATVNVNSHTQYDCGVREIKSAGALSIGSSVTPEDVLLKDNITVTWEIS